MNYTQESLISDFIHTQRSNQSSAKQKSFLNTSPLQLKNLNLKILFEKQSPKTPESPFRLKHKINLVTYKNSITKSDSYRLSGSSTPKLYSIIKKRDLISTATVKVSKKRIEEISNKSKTLSKSLDTKHMGLDKDSMRKLKLINLIKSDFRNTYKEMNSKNVITMPVSLQTIKQQIQFGTYKYKA